MCLYMNLWACKGEWEGIVRVAGRLVVSKRRKVPMRHINIGELSRGQASRLIKDAVEKDEPAYVLRYGKPLAVLISHERYERLIDEGIDPSEH